MIRAHELSRALAASERQGDPLERDDELPRQAPKLSMLELIRELEWDALVSLMTDAPSGGRGKNRGPVE